MDPAVDRLLQTGSLPRTYLSILRPGQPSQSSSASSSPLPILTHPDRSLQFTVEVDTSDTGVGAILSQH